MSQAYLPTVQEEARNHVAKEFKEKNPRQELDASAD
jgi:hypothetical protein